MQFAASLASAGNSRPSLSQKTGAFQFNTIKEHTKELVEYAGTIVPNAGSRLPLPILHEKTGSITSYAWTCQQGGMTVYHFSDLAT